MESATESIIRKLQANLKVQAAAVNCTPARWRQGRSADCAQFSLQLQDANSDVARQIIGEELERFLASGGGAEVRHGGNGGRAAAAAQQHPTGSPRLSPHPKKLR